MDNLYSWSSLIDDINTQNESEETISIHHTDMRDRRYKLKTLNTICTIGKNNNASTDIDKIKREIELQIEEDEALFGYTFFMASRPNFSYSWSYLRKQINKYMEFLLEARVFIDKIILDINWLINQRNKYKGWVFEFNNLFSVKYIDESPYVQVSINWDNFNSICSVKDGYYIMIKRDDIVFLSIACKYDDNIKDIFAKYSKFLKNLLNTTKK